MTRANRRLRLANFRRGIIEGLVPPELARRCSARETERAADIYWQSCCTIDPSFETRVREQLSKTLPVTSSLAGRPPNKARESAVHLNERTYEGSPHVCGHTERYVTGGACVYCARAIAAEQREARKELMGTPTRVYPGWTNSVVVPEKPTVSLSCRDEALQQRSAAVLKSARAARGWITKLSDQIDARGGATYQGEIHACGTNERFKFSHECVRCFNLRRRRGGAWAEPDSEAAQIAHWDRHIYRGPTC